MEGVFNAILESAFELVFGMKLPYSPYPWLGIVGSVVGGVVNLPRFSIASASTN